MVKDELALAAHAEAPPGAASGRAGVGIVVAVAGRRLGQRLVVSGHGQVGKEAAYAGARDLIIARPSCQACGLAGCIRRPRIGCLGRGGQHGSPAHNERAECTHSTARPEGIGHDVHQLEHEATVQRERKGELGVAKARARREAKVPTRRGGSRRRARNCPKRHTPSPPRLHRDVRVRPSHSA